MSNKPQFSTKEKALAWMVHTLTASGVVAAFMAIIAIVNEKWDDAMWWLIITLIIDGVDGSLARKFSVKEVLPNFDGKTVDNIIDFATYAIIPAFFMYQAKWEDGSYLLPENEFIRLGAIAMVLLVSAFYYGKKGMVSDDYYFIGFPVMWNLVAFYFYFVLGTGPWANLTMLVILSILHFVPIKFLYPSRTRLFFKWNIAITTIFIIANIAILFLYPVHNQLLSLVAMLTLFYFAGMGIYTTYFYKPLRK